MNRLKQLRTKAKLTLRDVEKCVNIRNATLSAIENGKQPFREIHVQKLTSFFDVSSDYLLGYSKIGIGIYFNGTADDDDHAYISESEYEQISERYEIRELLIEHANSLQWVIKTPVEETRFIRNKKSIFREVDIPKEKANIQSSVRNAIINEINRLDTQELNKVLKFIKEYIK